MTSLFKHLGLPRRRLSSLSRICLECRRNFYSWDRQFAENDVVLLKDLQSPESRSILTRPLRKDRKIQSHKGSIDHDSLIGTRARDVVRSSTGTSRNAEATIQNPNSRTQGSSFRILHPTLSEYISMTPRLVTPIYPADARVIVDQLDLHCTPPTSATQHSEPPVQILDGGTGHGSLALHLAREIAGANPPLPAYLPQECLTETEEDAEPSENLEPLQEWKKTCQAVVHSVDQSRKYSKHARKIVREFRNGLYSPHIDFHVNNVENWLVEHLQSSNQQPFLTHAILDLGNSQTLLAHVARAVKPDGVVMLFCPSITQITSAVKIVNEGQIPLFLERTLELGPSAGAGGRDWSIYQVRPRAASRKTNVEPQESTGLSGEEAEVVLAEPDDSGSEISGQGHSDDLHFVCRPMPGKRIIGGGFLGMWRKHGEKSNAS